MSIRWRLSAASSSLRCCRPRAARATLAAAATPPPGPDPHPGPGRLDARLRRRVRHARRPRPREVGLRHRLHRQRREAVLHLAVRERAGRGRPPRDRGPQGGLPGLRVHLRPRRDARPLRVPLRARRGAGEAADRPRHVAGHLDARREHRRRRAGRPAARSTSWRTWASTRCSSTPASTRRPTTTRSAPRRRPASPSRTPGQDFHVYAMEWYADRIEVFVDGKSTFSFRNEGTGLAHVALRQAAVPAPQPRDRRFLGRPEGHRRLPIPAPLPDRLREDLPAEVIPKAYECFELTPWAFWCTLPPARPATDHPGLNRESSSLIPARAVGGLSPGRSTTCRATASRSRRERSTSASGRSSRRPPTRWSSRTRTDASSC